MKILRTPSNRAIPCREMTFVPEDVADRKYLDTMSLVMQDVERLLDDKLDAADAAKGCK